MRGDEGMAGPACDEGMAGPACDEGTEPLAGPSHAGPVVFGASDTLGWGRSPPPLVCLQVALGPAHPDTEAARVSLSALQRKVGPPRVDVQAHIHALQVRKAMASSGGGLAGMGVLSGGMMDVQGAALPMRNKHKKASPRTRARAPLPAMHLQASGIGGAVAQSPRRFPPVRGARVQAGPAGSTRMAYRMSTVGSLNIQNCREQKKMCGM